MLRKLKEACEMIIGVALRRRRRRGHLRLQVLGRYQVQVRECLYPVRVLPVPEGPLATTLFGRLGALERICIDFPVDPTPSVCIMLYPRCLGIR
jgi:hypothetical protein